MLSLVLAMAASAYPSTPTGSAIVSIGSSSARACYQAAEARAATVATINECDLALDGGLSRSDEIATLVNRGFLKMIRGSNAAAEADFDAALRIEPAQAEAWLNKGVSLYQRGDSRAAVGLFGKAIELRTRRPAIAYYARGLANEDSGNIRAAYEDLNRARELAPRWNAPVLELARYQVRRR